MAQRLQNLKQTDCYAVRSKDSFFTYLSFYLEDSRMKFLRSSLTSALFVALVTLPQLAQAAAKAAENVVIVADTRRLDGIMLWWAQMYNESHAYFTLLTIAIIPLIGVVFGLLADLVMNHIGIDLKHRDAAE
jgi:ABC-type uncharacterized transport system involved in gliding motility auxiliary subunit